MSYVLFFSGLPCLSFDVIADDLGCNRSDFPHSMYLVAGSQAEKAKDNCVIVMKVYHNLSLFSRTFIIKLDNFFLAV